MTASRPHFLLFSEGSIGDNGEGRWRFALQSVELEEGFTATDSEPETRASRLELLAVVRGLEALDQPSRVTLVSRSRYVRRGIRRELNQWRERRWRWERFGNVVPIRDYDLWQRIDRALQFHQVECCAWTGGIKHESAAMRGSSAPFAGRRVLRKTGWNVAAMLGGLRRSVLTPIQSIWRQPFTRAA